MGYKEMCFNWVEEHKWEEDNGFFITDDNAETFDGPYTEEEIDDILWERAVNGEALEPFLN